MGTLMLLGGMLLMMWPFRTEIVDMAAVVGHANALRSVFRAEVDKAPPDELLALCKQLDEKELTP